MAMALSDKQPELVRLSKVAREFNLGLHTVVEFLWQRGHEVDGNPNTKIPYALYQLVKAEFQQEKEFRERAREAFANYQAWHHDHSIGISTTGLTLRWLRQSADSGKTEFVHDLAADVKNDVQSSSPIILIDIFLVFRDAEFQHYQDLGGIALLKFLRIMGVENHIILLSPWSIVELLRMDAGHHVLASKGVTVAQYTFSKEELKTHDGSSLDRYELLKLANEKAPTLEELRAYFKSAISLPKDERHNWANWWGLYVLVRLHNAYSRWKEIACPAPLVRELTTLKNRLAVYVHHPSFVNEEGPYPTLVSPYSILYIDDQADDGWEEVLGNVLCTSDGTRVDMQTVVPWPGALKEYGDCRRFYEERLHEAVHGSERVNACHMIILDVRLDRSNDEVEAGHPEHLSGLRLLKFLRERHPGIPVLALTASRRPEVHRALLDHGADRIHLKASLDHSVDVYSSAISIEHLVSSINLLGGDRYRLLYDFGEMYRRLRDGSRDYWWLNHAFPTGDRYNTARSFSNSNALPRFIEAMEGALQEYRFILQDYQNAGDENTIRFAFNAANLMNRLGGLVEFIHTGGGYREGLSGILYRSSDPVQSRNDLLGWFLLQCRNQASHYGPSSYTRRRHLDGFIRGLLVYLDTSKFPERKEKYNLGTVHWYCTIRTQKDWWAVDRNEWIDGVGDSILRRQMQGADLGVHMERHL